MPPVAERQRTHPLRDILPAVGSPSRANWIALVVLAFFLAAGTVALTRTTLPSHIALPDVSLHRIRFRATGVRERVADESQLALDRVWSLWDRWRWRRRGW